MEIGFLEQFDLFTQASSKSLQFLSKIANRHFYKKGITILDCQQSGLNFLYVIQGWVKIFKHTIEGEEIIVDVLNDQCYIGETFVFEKNPLDTYMAQSLSDIEIFTLPLAALKQCMQEDHSLSMGFLQATLKKQQQSTMQIEHLSIQNAVQRIGCFILRLCATYPTETNITLTFPYDKILLATRLGMRPETFSRSLTKLGQECKISIQGDKIIIPNLQPLIQYVCQQCSKSFPCNS